MAPLKKFVILMSNFGFGHRSAANAIAAALREHYAGRCAVEIYDPMESSLAPSYLRKRQEEYDKMVTEQPGRYAIEYQLTNSALGSAVVEMALALMLQESIKKMLEYHKPDGIIVVKEILLAPLSAVFLAGFPRIPVFTVVTDLTRVHRSWFNRVADICIVPTEDARQTGEEVGFPAEKIRVIGIPVHPRLSASSQSPEEVRTALGWTPERKTLLVVGSKRSQNHAELLRALNHSNLKMQIAVVAGGDSDLYDWLRRQEWHMPVYIHNYVNNMPTLMHAADMIACKAGGLIVAESLACGLPIMLTSVIEGQETGNARYVVEGRAGERVHSPIEGLELAYHWLADGAKLLGQYAENARKLGRPRAAIEIADLVWQAV